MKKNVVNKCAKRKKNLSVNLCLKITIIAIIFDPINYKEQKK